MFIFCLSVVPVPIINYPRWGGYRSGVGRAFSCVYEFVSLVSEEAVIQLLSNAVSVFSCFTKLDLEI